MITIVEGDLLQAKEDIIGHSVNCMGVMGGGVAKQIRNEYPKIYKEYRNICLRSENKTFLLGATFISEAYKENNHNVKYIANIFGQLYFGQNKQHTDYTALKYGLKDVKHFAQKHNKSVALPYGIGAGLGGGSWDVIYEIIEEVFGDYPVTLYKWKG